MVDIHCHALYGVDDGAGSIEESTAMLQQAESQGVETIVPAGKSMLFPRGRGLCADRVFL